MSRTVGSLCLIVATASLVALHAPFASAAPSVSGQAVEVAPLGTQGALDGADSSYAITYTTTDEHGQAALSNGQVYLPSDTPPAGGWPVLSWGKGTVGTGDQCATSTLLADNEPAPFAVELSESLLSRVLRSGVAVVSTDYIGLGGPGEHHYLNGASEGHALIDIVEAARTRFPSLSSTWMSAGHSQGGQAALVAGTQSSSYGAHLDFRGTVAVAPASGVENAIGLLSPILPKIGALETLTPTLIYILHGLRDSRPDLDVDRFLSPLGRDLVDKANDRCIVDMRESVAGVGAQQLLSRPLADPRFTAALREYMAVPTAGYPRPVTIEQGLSDQVVSPALTLALVAQMTVAGVRNLSFVPYPGATHYDIVDVSAEHAGSAIEALLSQP